MTNIVNFLETYSGVHNPIIYGKLISISHGNIVTSQHTNITIFTRTQLENGELNYYHDHSDTLNDTILIELNLLTKNISLCNVSVPVQVSSINDQPFRLITKEPQISIIENENYTITRDNLLTIDDDTEPFDIVYEILTKPSEGDFILIKDNQEIIKTFSQYDVNNNQLVYRHHKGTFYVCFYYCKIEKKKPIYKSDPIVIMIF